MNEPARPTVRVARRGTFVGSRTGACIVSLGIAAIAALPVIQNWMPEPVDDFPLSYYPMFSKVRNDTLRMTYAVGYDKEGRRHVVPYRYLGNGGYNQSRHQFRRRVMHQGADVVAREVASKIILSTDREMTSVRRVDIVTGKFSLTKFFLEAQKPLTEKVLASHRMERPTIDLAYFGLPDDPSTPNELIECELGQWLRTRPDSLQLGALGNLPRLMEPSTELTSPEFVRDRKRDFPSAERDFINASSPTGADLVTTLLESAEVRRMKGTYDGSVNRSRTAIRAIEIPLPETRTTDGDFTPRTPVFVANRFGNVSADKRKKGQQIDRDFEVALIDSHVTADGVEDGREDDFGLIVEVGATTDDAVVDSGQFVAVGWAGGPPGSDVDTLEAPGHPATVVILLDLDELNRRLGAETITRLFLVDAADPGSIDVLEAISLAPVVQEADAESDPSEPREQ